MEPGVADRLDGDRPRGAVVHREVQRPAEHPAVDRVEAQVGPERGEPLDPAVGVLDAALDRRLLVTAEPELPVLVVQRVPRAVGALEQHRAPREAERRSPTGTPPSRSVGGDADVLAHAPRVVARREPRVGRDLVARAVDLDPAGRRRRSGGSAARRRRGGSRGATADGRALRARAARPPRRSTRTRSARRRWRRTEPHPPVRLEHLVVDRSDAEDVGIVAQAPAPAHRPLLTSPRDARVAVEARCGSCTCRRRTRAASEPSRARRHRADLLGPRPVGLRHAGVRLDDLVAERLVGRDERPVFPCHAEDTNVSFMGGAAAENDGRGDRPDVARVLRA